MAVAINNNGGRKSDKLWRDALMVAVKRTDVDGRVLLAKIAEKCVLAAADGDLSAMKEIGDRLDGKAPQSLDVTTTHERSIGELNAAELSAEIARLKAALAFGGGAEEAISAVESDRVH